MRLAKFLAHAGVASRRGAEDLVRGGRVAIAGSVVTDPARAVDVSDAVSVDGVVVQAPPQRIVYALHKPMGVVSTASDPQRRPTVVDLIGGDRRLYPVGRLDIDTTGLILLTDDGELAHILTHPRFEVPKTYRARVAHPPVRDSAIKALRGGIELEDGITAPALVRRLAPGELELTIHEGRKRQVKRMCEAVGHPVISLSRVTIGPLSIGDLKPGKFRRLGEDEVALLRANIPG